MSTLLETYRQFLKLADEFHTIDALDIGDEAKEEAIYYLGLADNMRMIGFRVPKHIVGIFHERQNVQAFRSWVGNQEASVRQIVDALANRPASQGNLMDSGDGIIMDM